MNLSRFLHAWWPVAAVVLFTATLVLQIPRKALFFRPAAAESAEPFVSFVPPDDEEYAQIVRRIRMAWQMGGRPIVGGIADSRTDAFDFSDPLPPPAYLSPRPALEPPPALAPAPAPQALMPPPLGREMPPLPPAVVRPERNPGLLELPDGLQGECPQFDFTLKNTRSIK